MRVVMLTLDYHPVTGGAQKQIAALAPLLRARGAAVEVWTRAVPGQPHAESIDGIPVRRLGRPGARSTAGFAVQAALGLLRARPDVLHAHSLFSPAAIALLARQALGVPAVVKVLRGGVLGDSVRLLGKPHGPRRAAALAQRIDRFVAISTEIDRELDDLGVAPERRRFVPNGVDTERFRPLRLLSRVALRHDLGVGDRPLVVYAGRLVPEKGLDDMIAAWPRVERAHPGAELAVLGAGPCEAELRRRAPVAVKFLGDVADVAPYLLAADAFVLPSQTEGLSNALLEAMAAGLPIVATSVGGNADLIEDGVNGRLVPPRRSDALGDALAALLADAPLRRGLGARARRRVVDDYSLPATADRLFDLYRELVPAPRTRTLGAIAAGD
jgi:glycosyltransferase involved in cell wall biosynthesis